MFALLKLLFFESIFLQNACFSQSISLSESGCKGTAFLRTDQTKKQLFFKKILYLYISHL